MIRDHRRETEIVPAKRGSNRQVGEAPQADRETVSRCLSQVREAMIREGINNLIAKSQQEINTNCNSGNIEGAMLIVQTLATYQRCSEELEAYIRRNGLVVTNEVRSRALVYCRNGDIRKATETFNGLQDNKPHNAAEIISFAADKITVQKNHYITLSWQTANAAQVVLGRTDSVDPGKVVDRRRVERFGSQVLWPDRTTSYVLLVTDRATWKSKHINIQVNDEYR